MLTPETDVQYYAYQTAPCPNPEHLNEITIPPAIVSITMEAERILFTMQDMNEKTRFYFGPLAVEYEIDSKGRYVCSRPTLADIQRIHEQELPAICTRTAAGIQVPVLIFDGVDGTTYRSGHHVLLAL